MADMNAGGIATQEIIDKCIIELCKEKLASKSKNKALTEAVVNKKDSEQQYKLCLLVKAETAQRVYSRVNYCVSARAAGEIGEITEAINTIAGIKDDLNKGFSDLVKKIKETKNLMTEVEEVACRLDRCIEDEQRCNLDTYNRIRDIDYLSEDGTVTFADRIDEMEDNSDNCYELINQTFDASIKVAGILTFIETGSLQRMGENLTTLIKDFKKDVDENIAQSTKDIEAAVKDFNKIIGEVTELQYDYCAETVLCEGIENTMTWLEMSQVMEDNNFCTEEPTEILDRLEILCRKVMEDCEVPEGAAGEECPPLKSKSSDGGLKKTKNDKSDQWPIDQ